MSGTCLGLLFRKGTLFVCNDYRVMHDAWHGATPYGGPRILADRGSEALAPRTPSATPSGAARCELKTASGMTYGRGALAHTAPNDASILHGLCGPEVARPGGHGRRSRFVPGH